jgi:glycogen/starch/alpha-glucan phosphorylase-like protein
VRDLPERIIFQLNDTHPVIAIPELMRLLVDDYDLEWDEAWGITRQCFAYTCHTLLPEALEVWPVSLMERLLPRHMEIIYRINEGFLDEVREAYPGDELRVRRMSIIGDHPERSVRMAHLATVASVKVNGVAELHSQLLRDKVLNDFAELWPDKFTNVTNGVTPRRFVRQANPYLSKLDHRHHRRRLGRQPRPARASSRSTPRTRTSARSSAPSRPRTKSGSPACCSGATASPCPRGTCSMSWSSACTSTSASR